MKSILVMLLICCGAFAQQGIYVPPPVHETFDRGELIMRATYNDSIMPRYIDRTFYYINPKTGKKIFETGFETAYPFNGKCAIVKQHGKCGLIGLDGAYIVNPEYDSFEYANAYKSLVFSKITPDLEIELVEVSLITLKATNIIEGEIRPGYYRGGYVSNMQAYKTGNITAGKLTIDTIFSSYKVRVTPLKNKLEVRFGSFPDVVLTGDELAYHYAVQQPCIAQPAPMLAVGVRDDTKWVYYVLQHNGTFKKVVENKYRPAFPVISITEDREILVMHKNKFNIIYDDGSMLSHDYDFISGNMAVIEKDVYIVDKGVEYLYYKCKL